MWMDLLLVIYEGEDDLVLLGVEDAVRHAQALGPSHPRR